MIFRPKQKKPPASSPMKIDNTVSEEVEHIKFLGGNIDQHLAWKTHINFVCTKISKRIGMLYKAWFYVTRKSLLSLYLSLVYPYLTYHNVVWSSTYPTNIKLEVKSIIIILVSSCPQSKQKNLQYYTKD